jgi:hypothetical protein
MARSRLRQDLFEFRWYVNTEGYRWVRTLSAQKEFDRGDKEPGQEEYEHFITDLAPRPFTARFYYPLLNRGLFLRFTNTDPTQEGILAFASEFGLLGTGVRSMIFVPKPDDDKHKVMVPAESISDWNREIFAMRHALRLWQLVQANDIAQLSRYIQWQIPTGVCYNSHPDLPRGSHPDAPAHTIFRWIATEDVNPELLSVFQHGDPVKPAMYQIQQMINQSLLERISPRMLWGADGTRLGLHMVPSGLIGALWLQFAQAITGNKNYRRCGRCENFFEVSPSTARTNRRFCSDACKSKAFRERLLDAEILLLSYLATSKRGEIDVMPATDGAVRLVVPANASDALTKLLIEEQSRCGHALLDLEKRGWSKRVRSHASKITAEGRKALEHHAALRSQLEKYRMLREE